MLRNIGNLIANYIEEEKLNGKFIDIYDFLERLMFILEIMHHLHQ